MTACADCGVGTLGIGEWYMVRNEVWAEAWCGRIKPWHQLEGQMVLCIGCLEQRLGRTLCKNDFIDAPVNHLSDDMSKRMRARLTATKPTVAQ